MVLVPASEFFMGIAPGDHGMEPGRAVKVDAFFIDKLEVTAAQYASCVETGGCTKIESAEKGCTAAKPALARHPINCVDWYQADRYCRAQGKRLPTDAEWELAARGTDRRSYPWGNAEPGDQLCRQGRTRKPSPRTCEVGSFPEGASPYGVLDMAGNVAEWTAAEASGSVGHSYLVKGGGFLVDEMEDPAWRDVRVDKWVPGPTDWRQVWLGFRCARDVAAAR